MRINLFVATISLLAYTSTAMQFADDANDFTDELAQHDAFYLDDDFA